MKKSINKNKLASWFLGNASPKDKKQIFESDLSEEMLSEQFNKALSNSSLEMKTPLSLPTKELSLWQKKPFLRIAVAVIVLIGLAGLTYIFLDSNPAPIQYIEVAKSNPKGVRSTIYLPDGSVVNLNADSKIRFNKPFKPNSRTVKLSGEAYFSVTKDSTRPFRVITNDLAIEVLGTEFNVQAYEDDKITTTSLVEGSVKLEIPNQPQLSSIIMKPGQNTKYDKGHKIYESNTEAQDIYTSWKDGKFIVRNEAFDVIAKKLERRYNVTFSYSRSALNATNFTFTITDESLEEILTLLQKTTPFEFNIENRIVYITYKNR